MSDPTNGNLVAEAAFMKFCGSIYSSLNKKHFLKKLKEKEVAYKIDEKCFKICMSVQIEFYSCFDDCEIKYLSSKFVQDNDIDTRPNI
jgi:hypothetical protein